MNNISVELKDQSIINTNIGNITHNGQPQNSITTDTVYAESTRQIHFQVSVIVEGKYGVTRYFGYEV